MQFLKYNQKFFSVFFIVGILFGVFSIFPKTHAETADELQSQINNHNAQISALEKEIASYQTQLNATSTQAKTLGSALNKLDVTKKKLTTDIKVTENKVTASTLTIQKLSGEIIGKQAAIIADQKAISSGIRQIQQEDNDSLLTILLSKKHISDSWDTIEQLRQLHEKVSAQIEDMSTTKKSLEADKLSTEQIKEKMVSLKSQLSDQQKLVEQSVAQKNQLLAQTKNQEANYKKILNDKIALRDAFENELRNYEAKLKFTLNPNSLPNAHVLSWPLDNVFVTQLFGATEGAARLYVSGTHNGIDFRATLGTPVKAMTDGVVSGAGNTDIACKGASFGNWILIKYDNGLASTYGHLSLIKVVAGQSVKRGDIVGYSGNTGYSTGPHLHVSLYAASAVSVQSRPSVSCVGRILTMPIAPINGYLDPMPYMPVYTK